MASLAAVILGLAAVVFIGLKVSGLQLMNGILPPEVLDQKAREIIDKLGYSASAADHAAMFDYNTDFTDYVHEHSKPRPDWPKVLAQRPQVLTYSYRQSPVYLDPDGFHMFMTPGIVTFDDPPPIQSGMINIVLDAQGRLSYLQAIPDEVEPNPPPAQQVDWKPLFAAAGLDPAQFQSAAPTRLSLAAFDERAAWTGCWPGSDFPLRIEAAAWRGKPVFFDLIGPWSPPRRSQHESQTLGAARQPDHRGGPGHLASGRGRADGASKLRAGQERRARRLPFGQCGVRHRYGALGVPEPLPSHPRHLRALHPGPQHVAFSLRGDLDALRGARTLRATPLAARHHLLEPPAGRRAARSLGGPGSFVGGSPGCYCGRSSWEWAFSSSNAKALHRNSPTPNF